MEHLAPRAGQWVTSVGYGLLLAVVVTAALRKLGIDTSLLEHLFTLVVACVGLALAIAFGLGGRDRATAYLDRIGASAKAGDGEDEG